ncbi:MAG: hypothetical protein JST29_03230 [Bacteroidetes bacterium]|nr:hypothetical protein [Bacteroidota bacterium]
MSRTYKIITNQRIDISNLIDELRKRRIAAYAIDRAPTYLIFEDNFSARGIDLTEEDYGYEIRMTFLSNSNDYLLCNAIAVILCRNLNATLKNENGNEKYIGTLFYDLDISEAINSDINVLFALLNEGKKDITIYGPIREFTFGSKTIEKVLAFQGDKHAIAYKLSKLILACQYPPKNFTPFSNFLRIGNNDDEAYYVQVLSNKKDMVIEKVAQYAISTDSEKTIIIEAKELASIIPNEWEVLDDYIILAKQIEQPKWEQFIERAKTISPSNK